MGNTMPISGAVAGAQGSPYVAKVSSTNVGTGNYVINDTNFPGIGVYISGHFLIVPSVGAAMTFSVSTDNGTTWVANSATGPAFVYVDSGTTIRVNVAAFATNIFFYPMAL